MDLGIAGKRVLVTGASQGIGRAIALAFAAEGCRVAVIARRADKLEELVDEMGGKKAGHSFYATDLMPDDAPTRAVQALAAEDGDFEIVVNNVGENLGVRDPLSPVHEWRRVWRFNVGIAIEVNGLVVPPMKEREWGRIIHMSSVSAQSVRGSTPYAAAKAYLNAYTIGIGRSLAPNGIVVSALMPGVVLAEGGHWDGIRKNRPEIIPDFIRHHQAIGRLGTVDDITPFALFMASQHVRFATGAIIPVDGGTM